MWSNITQIFNHIELAPRHVIPLAILIVTYTLYSQFLWNPLVFDDNGIFAANGTFLQQYLSISNIFELRALPYASLGWTIKCFGLDPVSLRIPSLVLHSLVGSTLFFVIRKISLLTWQVDPNNKHDIYKLEWIAFFCALLFICHPITVYGAAYLSQRTIVMATLFGLLAILTLLTGITENRKGMVLISIVLYGLAVFSKEHAIMLPAIMLCLSILFSKHIKIPKIFLSGAFIAYGAIASYIITAKAGILGNPYEIFTGEMLEISDLSPNQQYLLSICTQCWLYFKYLSLWLIPNTAWMSVDIRVNFPSEITLQSLLGPIAFILYGIVSLWLLYKRNKIGLLGLALLFPWLLFLTELSTVRIQEPFVLYRSYLWAPGLFFAIPLLINLLSFRVMCASFITTIFILAAGATDRLLTFSHPRLLWEDAEKLLLDNQALPGAERIYYNLGIEEMRYQTFRKALTHIKQAIHLNPNFSLFHMGAGNAYYGMKNYQNAITEYSIVIALNTYNHTEALYWRGMSYKKSGAIEQATHDFHTSCKLGWGKSCRELELPD